MATLAERAAAAQARSQPKAEQRSEQSTPSAPVKLSKALQADADYDGPVERVELDGLAVLKILQHASGQLTPSPSGSVLGSAATTSSQPLQSAAGFLFGLPLGDRLSVSNAFALPSGHLLPNSITTLSNISLSSATNADARGKATKVASEREKEVDNAYRNAKNFVGSYLPRAKELNLDNEIVGGYFVSRDGMDLLKEGVLVDILVRYQFGVGSGSKATASAPPTSIAQSSGNRSSSGLAKYKPTTRLNRRAVAIVYDVASSTSSSLSLKAYSLSPNFLQLYENTASLASHRFDYASLAAVGLTPSTLFTTYPVSITSSALLTAFLAASPEVQNLTSTEHGLAFSALSADESLESNLRSLIGSVESANSSIQSLGFQGRDARFGGASGTSGQVDNLHRLESIRNIALADGAAKSLGQEAGLGTVRAWAARSSVVH